MVAIGKIKLSIKNKDYVADASDLLFECVETLKLNALRRRASNAQSDAISTILGNDTKVTKREVCDNGQQTAMLKCKAMHHQMPCVTPANVYSNNAFILAYSAVAEE